jgi:hypothetical protein
MNEIIPTTEIKDMAKSLGPLFGKKPEDMFALMLLAQAENKHPAIAAQEYDIIQGRPAINSRSAQARFQLSGGKIEWTTRNDAEVTAVFSHPQGGSLTITWNMERAAKAGLASKDMWKKYPAQMMSARVIAEGVRAVFPACLSGMYLPEEIQDFDSKPAPAAEPRNVTPAAQPDPAKPLLTGVQDAETVPAGKGDEPATTKSDIVNILKRVTAIVGPQDNRIWSDQQIGDLDLLGLSGAAIKSINPTMATVAALRAEIADQYRPSPTCNGSDWPVVVKDLLALGMDLEALEQRKAGLAG